MTILGALDGFFNSGPFMPHGHCYFWTPTLIALHAISDALIVLAYYSIPVTLVYFVRRRKDLEFHWMFVCFAVFILACGTTHLMEIWNIWHANYWLSGSVKAITAMASVPTAILLVRLIPQALALPSPGALQKARDELEIRVQERTAELVQTTKDLKAEIVVRQQAEEAFTQNQQLLRGIIDNSTAVIYAKDLEGRYLLVNRRFSELFHVNQDSIRSKTDYDLFPKEAADAFRTVDRRVVAAGAELTEEEIAPHDDGPHTYVSVKCPLWDSAGRPYAMFGISTDITERKLSEKALRESEERTRLIVDTALDAVITIDSNGIITGWNPQAEITFGWAPENAVGQSLRETIIPARYRDAHERGLKRYLATKEAVVLKKRIEMSAMHLDGHEFPIELAITPIQLGDRTGFSAFVRDITERKHAEEELRKSQTRFAAVFRSAPVAMSINTVAGGRLIDANEQYCAFFGYARDEIIGRTVLDLNMWASPEEREQVVQRLLKEGAIRGLEVKQRRRSGEVRDVLASLELITLANENEPVLISMFVDITERKQAEEKIRRINGELEDRVRDRTAKLEAVNQELESFSYSVSHDLRAPLRHVHGYVEMLKNTLDGQLAEKSQRYLEEIASASVEMGQLIDDLLAFSRLTRGEFREGAVNLRQLVDETIQGLELTIHGRNIVWKIGNLPNILGDRPTLKQVLANLIGNAVKYTRHRNPGVIEIGCQGEKNGRAVLFVRDNGAGFDMQYAHKLFGVFQRLHTADEFEGTGIGLAIVKRIVQRHGGEVWAEGALEKGAAFFFTLRAAETNPEA